MGEGLQYTTLAGRRWLPIFSLYRLVDAVDLCLHDRLPQNQRSTAAGERTEGWGGGAKFTRFNPSPPSFDEHCARPIVSRSRVTETNDDTTRCLVGRLVARACPCVRRLGE